MRISRLMLLVMGLCAGVSPAADKQDAANRSTRPMKWLGIQDRAGGTHNVSNIGLFFENRGKLYPRRLTDGPCGEFPINSGRHYIYRINPLVAVAANPAAGRQVNVIQGRFTQNEEWEAVGGYHNPAFAKIAFSDNPVTWPDYGWPVQDADGNPVIVSDQDSYCVYNDAENSVAQLGLEVIQRGYAYGLSLAEDILFFRFEIVNKGSQDLEDVYFNLYSDMDIGNISGGVPEWEDDLVNILPDRNCVYFYDHDDYSSEWGGATGYFAVTFLQTPMVSGTEPGLTDVHWNTYYDDIDNDSLLFALISSDQSYLPAAFDPAVYFHPGPQGDPHFDDPAILPATGQDIVAWLSSGPYDLARGDTLSFITALVAGVDENDMLANLDVAYDVLENNFNLPKPPATPQLSGIPGDGRVTLYWNDLPERSLDAFSGEYDFEGYRIYKSIDKGLHWDQVDRNLNPALGPDPIPQAVMDIVNTIGDNTGIQYSFVDSSVYNGFEYWYCLTAFDRGSSLLASLESPLGKSLDAKNTVAVIPRSKAIGRIPVHAAGVTATGSGQSNYRFDIRMPDDDIYTGYTYDIAFTYNTLNELGDLRTVASLTIPDSALAGPYRFGIEFAAADRIKFHNFTLDTVTERDYPYRTGTLYDLDRYLGEAGIKVEFSESDTSFLPEEGDLITIAFAVNMIRDGTDTVAAGQPFVTGSQQASDDGVLFSLNPPEMLTGIGKEPENSAVELDFSVGNAKALLDTGYFLTVSAAALDYSGAPFVAVYSYYQTAAGLVALDSLDTLRNGDTFSFNGVTAALSFDENTPPAQATQFVLATVRPVLPSLADHYRFSVAASGVDAAELQRDLNQIRVVPNPYVTASLWEPEFGELRYEPLRHLQFINLPAQSTVYILTIAGDLVKTLKHNSNDGTATWDLRAEGGREIAPGIYLYLVRAEGFEYLNRFAVIK